MNQAKRHIDEETLSHTDTTKKIRKLTFDKNDEEITCIEDLSTEIFFEIFDYLNGYDIFQIFSKLNTRFYRLINYSFLPIKIEQSTSSNYTTDKHYQQFIIENKQRITSISIHSESDVSCFTLLSTNYQLFNRLQSLTLENIHYYILISFLENLSILPRLFSLKISDIQEITDLAKIYTLIFGLSVLKYLKFTVLNEFLAPPLSSSTNIISPIKYLVAEYTCSVNDIFFILSHTPSLDRLSCTYVVSTGSMTKELPVKNLNLKYFTVNNCNLNFNQFEVLIKKLFFQLQSLRFTTTRDNSYIDAPRWEKLIVNYMPYLRILNFEYFTTYIYLPVLTPYYSVLSQFISSFWIERKWYFEMKIHTSYFQTKTTCSIRPLKKQWYELQDYDNSHRMTIDSTLNQQKSIDIPFSFLHLDIEDIYTFVSRHLCAEYARASIFQVKFTNLHLKLYQFSITMLTQILNILPNLDSLTIMSEIPEDTKIFSIEQDDMFRHISTTNTITKVNLEQISELDQVHILLNLCPHIRNLQVKCRKFADAEWLIRYILTKQNTNFVPHLYLICIWISTADDKIMNNLQRIIINEKLNENFSFNRICDRIYFQWK